MDGQTYTLVRSRRKTVSLCVQQDLEVVVRAPLRMSQREIDRFVEAHRSWIEGHRQRMAGEASERAAFCYADGQAVPVGGEALTIRSGAGPRIQEGHLLMPPDKDRAALMADFLRQQATQRVTERVAHFSPVLGVRPTGVKITSAKTRWGSCSGRNSICFSWRVACLPDDLLDYIVVHELAHVREHNHSARFWSVVAQAVPDYAKRRAALREFQKKILF